MFSDSERIKLIQTLNSLPFAQFEQVVFAISIPRSVLPGATAPQGERVVALLKWSEDTGKGLLEVENIINKLIGIEKPHQKEICPYKGLRFFDCNDEDYKYFFGREFLVKKLLDKSFNSNFLAIVGASGSGKSSLVRAGLLQILKNSGDNNIRIVLPGENPLDSLATAFVDKSLPHIERAQQQSKAKEFIKTRSDALKCLIETSEVKKMILFIDQFEEVFSLCQSQSDRNLFFRQLVDALTLEASKVCLIIAIRSDFVGKFYEQSYEGLSEKIRDSSESVMPMKREDLEQIIVRPAHQVGLVLEPDLSQALLDDISSSPGKLALLEFTLAEIWKRKQDNTLTLSAYFDLGRVAGSLQTQANKVYYSLSLRQKQIAKLIFLNLAFIGEDDTYMRNRIPLNRLNFEKYSKGQITEVVKRLSDEKLIITDEIIDSENGEHIAVIDIAHEELIYSWPKFKGWLKENVKFIIWKQKNDSKLEDWVKHQRDESFLLRGMNLREAEIWLKKRGEDVAADHHEFIEISIEIQKKEKEKEQKIIEFKASIIRSIDSDPILAASKFISSGHTYFHDSSDRLVNQNWSFKDNCMNFFGNCVRKTNDNSSKLYRSYDLNQEISAVSNLASQILGSFDIFMKSNYEPNRSINFFNFSDKFILNDLILLNPINTEKSDCKILDTNNYIDSDTETLLNQSKSKLLKIRQIKSFLTILFIAQGIPMFFIGNEFFNISKKNSNSCQSFKSDWLNWETIEKEANLLRFTQSIIHLIKRLKIFQIEHVLRVTEAWHGEPHIVWHGVKLGQPDWSEHSRSLAFTLCYPDAQECLHVMLNADWDARSFELPILNSDERWYRIIDTAVAPPKDCCTLEQAPCFNGQEYLVKTFSSVVFMVRCSDK